MRLVWRAVPVLVALSLWSGAAAAQDVSLTGGSIILNNSGDAVGFTLTGPGTKLTADTTSFDNVQRFTPGASVDLSQGVAILIDPPGGPHPITEMINGTSYNAYVRGSITFTARPFTVVAGADGAQASFRTLILVRRRD